MRNIIGILLLVFLSFPLACSQKPLLDQNQEDKDKQAVLELERRLGDAFLSGKWEEAERMLADDYVQTDADGRVRIKSQVIAAAKEWNALPESIRPLPIISIEDVNIRIYGNAAIVTGKSSSKQQYSTYEDLVNKRPPREVVNDSRYTAVWVKRNETWKLVTSQSTRMPEKGKEK